MTWFLAVKLATVTKESLNPWPYECSVLTKLRLVNCEFVLFS